MRLIGPLSAIALSSLVACTAQRTEPTERLAEKEEADCLMPRRRMGRTRAAACRDKLLGIEGRKSSRKTGDSRAGRRPPPTPRTGTPGGCAAMAC